MANPSFDCFRTVLLRTGELDRVPLGDIGVHSLLKKGVLGRPLGTIEDEVAFGMTAGYDYGPIEQGLQLADVIRRQSMQGIEASLITSMPPIRVTPRMNILGQSGDRRR